VSSFSIDCSELSKQFGSVFAVHDVSFTVSKGQIVGLLGGNGAGKTTTISMILGLVSPTSGSVHVLGSNMHRNKYNVLHRMNFESPYVDMPHRLSARQNLAVFARLYDVEAAEERIAELSEMLQLKAFLDRPVGKLSAGQKTRVSLAKALINTPEVLLLDEPTASLDPDTADWVRTHLEDYRDKHGASILLASHNMPEVERLCDDVIMLKKGSVENRGTPAELLKRYGRSTLEEVFLLIAREGTPHV
jgi:ABC-2 type transport system ATP-binding protein